MNTRQSAPRLHQAPFAAAYRQVRRLHRGARRRPPLNREAAADFDLAAFRHRAV